MLFNSFDFFIFCPIIFASYWLLKDYVKYQNFLIFIASYLFYGWWDWRFTFLILFSSIVDYILGLQIYKTSDEKIKNIYLGISLVVNLGLLVYFKYFNFFITEFATLLAAVGFKAHFSSLSIILPIGISFYTFQTLSYTIDIYKKRIEPTSDFIAFSAFVSFFPQLVAGPVERAKSLLPQFLQKRHFSYKESILGCQQILWGFFKKIVIADNCALFVNDIFGYGNYSEISGIILLIGAILFIIQIYADFSGYSDIAIGVAKLFGFKLMQNFNCPYFVTSITEFWRKWNISVSTWFRDYMNQPLLIRWRDWENIGVWLALFTTFAIMGLWHGAGWHFVVYGMIHGVVMVIEISTRKKRKKLKKKIPKHLFNLSAWFITMSIWTLSLVFFRAENIDSALTYIASAAQNLMVFNIDQITSRAIFKSEGINLDKGVVLTFFIYLMFLIEWINRKYTFGLKARFKNPFLNWVLYYLLLFSIFFFGEFNQQEFIYFQF